MATSEVVSFDYNHGGENGDTDQDNEMEDSPDEEQNISDPKLFKATLCQFYLKGPCKNGYENYNLVRFFIYIFFCNYYRFLP